MDSKIRSVCPSVINKLKTACEDASSNDPESWSHVGSSCRRIIKDVADTIFPAQSEPVFINGKEYKVDDSGFINRIIVSLRMKSVSNSTTKFNESMVNYVDSFLRNIQSYSSKGDHTIYNKADAARCIIYTYMLIGDILRYYIDSEFVTKVLGKPSSRNQGIQKYADRKTSPFEDLLHEAKSKIIFVSTSHELVARFKKDLIKEVIQKDIVVTIMVLDSNSPEVKRKEMIFQIKDLSKKIEESLHDLCQMKKDLGDRGNKLIIKKYDADVSYSYIVIDPNTPNAIIKIEDISENDPDKRNS